MLYKYCESIKALKPQRNAQSIFIEPVNDPSRLWPFINFAQHQEWRLVFCLLSKARRGFQFQKVKVLEENIEFNSA